MIFSRCTNCQQYGFTDTHRCPPTWHVRISNDDQEEPQLIFAHTAQDAAQKFMAHWDADASYGYTIASGHETEVSVSPSHQPDDEQVFVVTGEMVPQYHATPKPI